MRTKVVTAMLGILAAMLIAVDPAYAAEESRKATTEAAESETEETKKETKKATEKATEKPTEKHTEKETKNSESVPFVDDFDLAFSPEGNLILVDDFVTSSGKQFMTVMTKAGNTFYIIVDRDADGNRNVHFLNQVDERDLLTLMDESEAEEASASLESEKEEREQKDSTTVPDETKAPEKEEGEKDKLKSILTIAVPIAVVIGVLILFIMKKKKSSGHPVQRLRDRMKKTRMSTNSDRMTRPNPGLLFFMLLFSSDENGGAREKRYRQR